MIINERIKTAINILYDTDSYKVSHRQQYPPYTQYIYSNWTNRGSCIPGVAHSVNFGLQGYIKYVLLEKWSAFFDSDIIAITQAYQKRCDEVFGPHIIDSDHIRALHSLGYLPLKISQIPEGSLIPIGVPSFTIENTHPDFFWLTNYIETSLSAYLWQPITSATTAWNNHRLLNAWAIRTGANLNDVAMQGHDFSARGLTGTEPAQASGAAHLLSFRSTDTLIALDYIERYYGPNTQVIGVSVPATEHSVMCAGGKEHEKNTFARLLDTYPTGILAIVSDTWNLWHVLDTILPELKNTILTRDGRLMIRPDSGDPELILCGNPNAAKNTPEYLGVIPILWNLFGGTINSSGYKVLNTHIGTIYGDSITHDRAHAILANLARQGFVSTSIVFGFGSCTYQAVTRDTLKSAIKATWVQIDGKSYNIAKDPITDNGEKRSATGRLAVKRNEFFQLELIQKATPEQEEHSLIQPVFYNGTLLIAENFDTVRTRLHEQTQKLEEAGILTSPLDI